MYFYFCDIIINRNYKGDFIMAISYKRLWKLLIDKDLKKKDLIKKAGVSNYTLNKLNKGETVTSETLAKICVALGCGFDDIMEVVEE
jgi:DNA-binding Xre family transcriptional regulator